MVGPTPRYARCRISGEQVRDGSYGCVIDPFDDLDDVMGVLVSNRGCSCKLGECKAPGQQPSSVDRG